jgi:peroxiredoxin
VSDDPQEVADRFRAELELPYALVGDPDHAIIGAYGARWPILHKTRRVTYIVARDRRIRLAYRSEVGFEAHVSRVEASLGVG